jgi:hypothetical protein
MGTGKYVLFPRQKSSTHHLTIGASYPDDASLEFNHQY